MEFKVGDKVRFINNHKGYISKFYYEGINPELIIHGLTTWDEKDCNVVGISNSFIVVKHFSNGRVEPMQLGYKPEDLILVSKNNSNSQETMEKQIISVLVIDKKTGKTNKDVTVVANNENQAILKAFGIDAENLHIKTTVIDKYTEEPKPVQVEIKKV